MGKWDEMYQNLQEVGLDVHEQLSGTKWLDRFILQVGDTTGKSLDLGCGLGADMLRCAALGYEPHGLDLESQAVEFVNETYGFASRHHNFGQPLPYPNEMFSLVLSRFALHYLYPTKAYALFREIHRVLKPSGKLLFAVNSKSHRELGLQYDYTDAIEVEPNVWRLPNDRDRTFLFYTPEIAKELAGDGWVWHYLEDEQFEHWSNIHKRAVVGFCEKL